MLELLNVVLTIGGVLSITVNMVEFCLTLLLVSVAYPVTFIVHPPIQVDGRAVTLLICAEVPDSEKLMNVLPVVKFHVMLPNNNPVSSVKLNVIFNTSLMFIEVIDLLREPFIIGKVVSVTISKVLFCFTLLEVSVINNVKLTTSTLVNVVVFEICPLVPEIE